MTVADAILQARSHFGSAIPDSIARGYIKGVDCTVAIDTCTRAPADSGPLACDVLPYATEDFTKFFTLGREIGRGSYGIVRECHRIGTGEVLACKVIQKAHLKTVQDRKVVAREIGLMEMVRGHPAVVSLEGVFENEREVTLVMELANGGELYHQILTNGRFPEPEAAAIFAQMVDAIRHVHKLNVIHRDLKPENLLFHHRALPGAPEQFTVEVKLADFGLGTWLGPGQTASARIGSLMYEAPEVVCGAPYDSQADMWSLGVILHALLSGTLPFIDNDQQKLARKICAGAFELRYNPWPFISDEAKSLVRRLIVVNPRRRPTAAEVLNDPWLLRHLGPASPRAPLGVDPKLSPAEGGEVPEHPNSGGASPEPSVSLAPLLPASPRGNKREILSEEGYESCSDPEAETAEAAMNARDSFTSALSAHSAASFGSKAEGKGSRRRHRWRQQQHTCCAPFLEFRWWLRSETRAKEPETPVLDTVEKALLFQKLQPEEGGAALSALAPKESDVVPASAKFAKAHHARQQYYQMEEGGAGWNAQHRGKRRLRRFFSSGRGSAIRF